MSQAKISAFFKPSCTAKPEDSGNEKAQIERGVDGAASSPSSKRSVGKALSKKRTYAQYHLELGQPDFLLRSCSVCGLMYACGDEADEKLHKTYHKNYNEGIPFKGWRDERVASSVVGNEDRILLVVDSDPPAQKRKVQEVLKMMEKELGYSEGCLLHKLCKVYMFISSRRIIGCLIAEPIKTAHKLVSNSSSHKTSGATHENSVLDKTQDAEMEVKSEGSVLQFGGFNFKRDVIRKGKSGNGTKVDQWDLGAILCEEEAVPALCGFRAIWVVPLHRRKGIASQLLDAARKTFDADNLLQPLQCAFSPPTSAGRALAASFCRSSYFLIYREDNV